MATCFVKDVFWWKAEEMLPEPGQTVLVSGGIAFCSKDGIWYSETGSDHGRPIAWKVEYWAELPDVPNEKSEGAEGGIAAEGSLSTDWLEGKSDG